MEYGEGVHADDDDDVIASYDLRLILFLQFFLSARKESNAEAFLPVISAVCQRKESQ
jgi:hypothetical protein